MTRWPAPRVRRGVRHVVACIGAVGALALVPVPALAHAHLQGSTPDAGARLAAAPTEIRLTFSELPELAVSSVRLTGPGGVDVPLGALAVAAGAPRAVVTAIRGPLVAGAYTVIWQAVGDDGHPTRGQFAFTIGPGARGLASGSAAAGARLPPAPRHDPVLRSQGTGFGAESPLYAAIRWLQYAGLVIAIGAVAFRVAVLGRLTRTRRAGDRPPDASLVPALRTGAALLGLGATLAVGVAAVMRLVAQSCALYDAGAVFRADLLGAMLVHTMWGWGWLVQMGGVLLAVPGFAAARRPRGAGQGMATLGTMAMAASPALSGHAVAAPQWTTLTVLADVAHVVGAGGWLGSLFVLVVVGIPVAVRSGGDARGPAVADLVHAFSPTALVFAGLVAATGVVATWVHVGTVAALWQTAYGRTLLVKLLPVACLAALGAYHWRRVQPALATDPGGAAGTGRLRRSAGLELLVGALVLAATAVLVATPPAVDVRAEPPHAAR